MNLFERIQNKRYDLQEVKKRMGGGSNSSSNNNTRTQNQRKNIKKEFGPGYDKKQDLIFGDPKG